MPDERWWHIEVEQRDSETGAVSTEKSRVQAPTMQQAITRLVSLRTNSARVVGLRIAEVADDA